MGGTESPPQLVTVSSIEEIAGVVPHHVIQNLLNACQPSPRHNPFPNGINVQYYTDPVSLHSVNGIPTFYSFHFIVLRCLCSLSPTLSWPRKVVRLHSPFPSRSLRKLSLQLNPYIQTP